MVFLTACTPYGLIGDPDSDSDDNKPTSEEIVAMENIITFPIELKQFEENVKSYKHDFTFNETDTGFTTNKGKIEVDYKSEESTQDERLTNIYVF